MVSREREIVREGQRSLAWLGEFIAAEGIDCDYGVVGRFHAAHNPRQFELLARAATHQTPGLEVPAEVVPRAEQRRELGTDAYWGGVLYTRHASGDGVFAVTFATVGVQRVSTAVTSNMGSPAVRGHFTSPTDAFDVVGR